VVRLRLRDEPLGDPAQPIRAVLFDKDGTLCRSEPMLLALAEARIMHCHRLLQRRHPSLAASLGSELEHLLRRAYGLDGAGVNPAGTTAVASRRHNLLSTATVLAMVGLGWPEAVELGEAVFAGTDNLHGRGSVHRPQATEELHGLVELLAGSGLRCAVISNDEAAGIADFLEGEGIARHFQAFRSAEQTPRKPDPAAVLALCGDLGVEPGACALIGDANSDLRMARAAGVPVVIGYTAGWSRRPPLDPAFPQLHHWSQLTLGE
jgi:phosphoglycolate phosphatase